MMRVAALVGSAWSEVTAGSLELPASDRGALALALKRFGRDVRAYTCDPDARAYARAAGVEWVAAAADLDPDGFDVALIGRGGCGEEGDARPARLAEARAAALVYAVIDVSPEADRVLVTRDLGRGARDVLAVRGPAVLVVADSIARGRYVSRYRIHAERAGAAASPSPGDRSGANMASQETWANEMSVQGAAGGWESWEFTTPRVRLGDHASRVAGSALERMNALFGVGVGAGRAGALVRGSAKQCAFELLRYLAEHDLLARGAAAQAQRAPERNAELQPRSARGAVAAPLGEARPEPVTPRAAAVAARIARRPRRVNDRSRATRGPFEIGVDH